MHILSKVLSVVIIASKFSWVTNTFFLLSERMLSLTLCLGKIGEGMEKKGKKKREKENSGF